MARPKNAVKSPRRRRAGRRATQITTDRHLASLKPGERPYEASVSGARGLLIRVFPDGARVFEVRYVAIDGTRRRMQLGPYPGLKLADARTKATKARTGLSDGRDPAAERIAAKRNARTGETIADLAGACFKAAAKGLHGGRKKPKREATIAHERSMFERHIAPRIGDRRFADIRRADIKEFMRNLVVADELAPASIARVGEILSGIFAFAVFEDRLESNPVLGLAAPLAFTSRERRFDDNALKALWQALVVNSAVRKDGKAQEADPLSRLEPSTPLALRFALLTLCRRSEAAGARWREIDRKLRLWEIPAARTKAGRVHLVPLSGAALEVLDCAARIPGASDEFVFPAPSDPKCSLDPTRMTRATARLCARLGLAKGSTHDFRRTGATILAGRYGISGFIIGHLLGHAVHDGPAVTQVYNRHTYVPEQRRALNIWARHLLDLAEGREPAGNIVEIRTGASA